MKSVQYKYFPSQPPSVRILPQFEVPYELWLRTALEYDINVKEKGFTTSNAYFKNPSFHVSSRDILLCSGLLTSAADSFLDFTAWGLYFQYAKALRPSSGHLRLAADVRDWDSRKKSLLSESLALGLAGYAMWFHDEIVFIADAGPFIGRSLAGPFFGSTNCSLTSLKLYGKNGGYKPDLFCITSTGECIIAEVKAGLGSPSCLANDIIKGKKQVQNVKPVGISERTSRSRLVFATNFRYDDETVKIGKDTCLLVADPNENEMALKVRVSLDEIALSSYFNALRLSHRYDILAALSASKEPVYTKEQLEMMAVSLNNYSIFPLYGDESMLVGVDMNVAVALFASPRQSIFGKLCEALAPYRKERFSKQDHQDSLFLPNGIIIHRNAIDEKGLMK